MAKVTRSTSKAVKSKSSKNVHGKSAPITDEDIIRALEEQLAQREAELAVINSIQTALVSKLDFQGIIDAVGEKLGEIFEDGNVGIGFLDKARNVVKFPYVVENGKRIENFEISLDQPSVLSHTVKRRRPFVLNTKLSKRFGTGTFNFPGLDQRDLKSWLSVPIFHKDEIIGGISLRSWQRENAYNVSTVRLLQTIANSMSVALENVRLFDETNRLLKETDQRATELQIINNIGQTLTEGLDLDSTLEHVGERLRKALNIKSLGIVVYDPKAGLAISNYFYHYGRLFTPQRFSMSNYKLSMRLASRVGYKPWAVNTNAERYWKKFLTGILPEWKEVPKAFVVVPLLAGGELVGSITIGDYEDENAFVNLPLNLLETIASNMGAAIQNVRLFDETQRLLKETEQRATELQIINNIGQALTEGLDLNSMIERVAERLHEVLKVDNIAITIINPNTGQVIAQNKIFYSTDPSFATDRFSLDKFKSLMRISARGGNQFWVMNTNAEKSWRKYAGNFLEGDSVPKSFVALPLLVGKDAIGGIIFADYEKENAFIDLPIRMLETIAYNMGTGIQNVLLFDETQHLLNETDQRATELQIINNIGQMLTEGLDLQSTLERVGERLREVLKVDSLGIIANDTQTGLAVAHSIFLRGIRIIPNRSSLGKNLFGMQFAARVGGKPLVVNSNVEKNWRRFIADVPEYAEIPKSFVIMPLLAGKELVGSITIADYEEVNAFRNLPINLLETIASNMGTAIQNVRLFDETQRLLKETEQRAAELQIINDIGQTITGELNLNALIEHVGDKLRETFNVKSLRIAVADTNTGFLIALYMYRNGKRVAFDESWQSKSDRFRSIMRASARGGGRSWVVNTNAEKGWRKFALVIDEEDIPKSFVMLPLLAGREVIGGIYIPNYEKENAFTDFSIGMLETIAANMGTAIQNIRLFDETKKLFKDTEEARAAAERANKAKSTFLANMSHELRTPLNAIIGFTRIVKKKAEGALPEKQIENLDKVLISSEHLLGLINTVLDIAKIEAGRMDVIPAKFSVSVMADQCATLASPLLKPDVTLEKQVDGTIGFIFSDQDKIKQILLNLLSNAAKFTQDGKILLSVQRLDEENVNISVTDSGIGISEEALGRVFEEFQQADTSTTREYGGTGLGLSISRNLARLLGGDLTATSELGVGSTFTLTIPIRYEKKTASRAADPKPDSTQSAESQADDELTNQNGSRDAMKTILIVEDTEFNIDVLTQLLNDDYHMLIARDGAQGVSMAQENNPDLILMDVSLPVMDGYEATRKIREAKKSIPIIGLSAHAMSGDAEKAREAGCDDYLTKPVDEILLIQKLNQYLR